MLSLREEKNVVLLLVRVKPRGRCDAIEGVRGEALLLRVTVAPEDGKANARVLEVLALALDVPKASLSVACGASVRDKWIFVSGLSTQDVSERLAAFL